MKNNDILETPRSRSEAILLAICKKTKKTVVSSDTVTSDTLVEDITSYNSDRKLVKGTHVCKNTDIVITDFTGFCAYNRRINTLKRIYTSHGTCFRGMFEDCRFTTLNVELDTSNGTDFSSMFRYCSSLTSVPELDTSNGTDFSWMFANCSSLKSIPKLDLSKATSVYNMFWFCSSLRDVTFTGAPNFGGLDLSYSPLLTKASITSLVNALPPTKDVKEIFLSKTAVNNAFTTEEWDALKATKPTWSFALTDRD